MAELVLKKTMIFMRGMEFSNNLSQVNMNLSVDLHDRTGFGSSGRQRQAGLKDIEVSGNGFWNAGATSGFGTTDYPDPKMFNQVGSSQEVWSILPDGTSECSPGYSFKVVAGEYSPGATIGDMLGFTFAVSGDGGSVVRGKVIGNGNFSSDKPNSTACEIGAVTSSEDAYIALHLLDFSSSGGAGTIEVITAAASGMAAATTLFSVALVSSDDVRTATMYSTNQQPAGSTGFTWWQAKYTPTTTDDNADVMINAGIV